MDAVNDKAKIDNIVNKLCDECKSHSYQICRKEAKEIGLKVTDAPADVDIALMNLLRFYIGRSIGLPQATPIAGQMLKLYLGWLESANLQLRCEADMRVEKDNKMKVQGDRWVKY